MAGHRRISTDLFKKYLNRRASRSKIEALLELNLDDYQGTRRSVRGYARIWRWSRDKVAALIDEYTASLGDLKESIRGESDPASDRPPTRPQIGHSQGQESSTKSADLLGQSAGQSATNRPPTRPQIGHNLELQPEPEGRGVPRKPSARKIGEVNSRSKQAAAAVEAALAKAPPETAERRAERKHRLEILAEMFLACHRVPDVASLCAYFRSTEQTVHTSILEASCDAAREATEGTFPPAENEINKQAKRLFVIARRRARDQA